MPDSRPTRSTLRIHRLRVPVRLGWTEAERATPQLVDVDLVIRFGQVPAACLSDEIEGTVDYAVLTEAVRVRCGAGEYRLLEYLAAELYREVASGLPPGVRLGLRVSKDPRIEGVAGGASFTLGEEPGADG